MSTVLKKVIHQQVSDYLTKGNLLYEYQSEFRQDSSTDTSLIFDRFYAYRKSQRKICWNVTGWPTKGFQRC